MAPFVSGGTNERTPSFVGLGSIQDGIGGPLTHGGGGAFSNAARTDSTDTAEGACWALAAPAKGTTMTNEPQRMVRSLPSISRVALFGLGRVEKGLPSVTICAFADQGNRDTAGLLRDLGCGRLWMYGRTTGLRGVRVLAESSGAADRSLGKPADRPCTTPSTIPSSWPA
jgi:hypothetical protein